MNSVSGDVEVAAVRHLFRHLDDVASLRGNSVVQQLFGVSKHSAFDAGAMRVRIRSAVVGALESMTPLDEDHSRSAEYARRLRTILERCDLNGEPHRTVASELGVCVRQLYRDRQEAFTRLVDVFRNLTLAQERHVPAAAPASIDDVELQLKLYARLDSVGQFELAHTILQRLEEQPLTRTQRALVTHRLVETLCNSGSIADARGVLAKAKHELAKGSCDEPEQSVVRAEISGAESVLAFHTEDAASAIDHAERGLALLRPYHGRNVERLRSLVVDLSNELADGLWGSGEAERAIRAMDQAKAFVDDGVDAANAMELHFRASQVHGALQWGVDMALQENTAAYEIARRSGHARYEAMALGNFCPIHFLRGNYAEALQYGRKALLVAEFVARPIGVAQLLLNMARVAITLGDTAYALELLVRARQQPFSNDPLGGMIDVVEAEALAAQGRFEAAAQAAHRARVVFESCGNRKQLALALCAEAHAYAGLAKKRNAVSVIRAAVDLAESFGSAYSVMSVYRVSAEITGNKRHATYAAGIDSALRA